MSDILIYTSKTCGYCTMAKRLLDKKAVRYTEVNVDAQPELREELMHKTKQRTVPQIFIGERHIGGFDQLYALEQQNALDPLLIDYKL